MADCQPICADSHVSEPPDLSVSRLDKKYCELAPWLVVDPPRLEDAYYIYQGYVPHALGIGLAAGKSPEELAEFLTKATYADAASSWPHSQQVAARDLPDAGAGDRTAKSASVSWQWLR